MSLTKRQVAILRQFIASNEPITIHQLMDKYQKSERSIRYDILQLRNELEDHQIQLKLKNGTGYYLSASLKPDVITLLNDGVFDDVQYSNLDLIDTCFACLYVKAGPVILDDLVLEVASSKGTLNKAIKQFNDNNSEIQMDSSRKGICLLGDEYEIRMRAIRIENIILKISPGKVPDRDAIRDAIRDTNQKYSAWHTKDSFEALADFCLVSFFRQKANHIQYQEEYLNLCEINYAQDLLKKIGYKTTKEEIAVMTEMLMKSHISFGYDSMQQTQLKAHIGEFSHRLTNLAQQAGYQVDRESLNRDLYTHLKQLAKCIRYGIELPDNPMMQEIKMNYPEMFDLAKQCSEGWMIAEDVCLSDSEISYIAIYLYKNINQSFKNAKRALIICATGKGLSSLLASKVSDRFPNLEIVGLESAYGVKNSTFDNLDFIISTIPIPNTNHPVIVVSPLFTKEDEDKIETVMRGNGQREDWKNLSSEYADKMTVSNRKAFADFAEIQKTIVLGITDLISSLPAQYHPSNESVLSLLIHLNMAIPRWMNHLEPGDKVRNKEILDQYQKQYPDLAEILNTYFKSVEDLLSIKLDDSEKNAFYLYILS